jgi:hypothetical protein
MKILIGKQALQLEELFYASCLVVEAELQLDDSVAKILAVQKGNAEPTVLAKT